MITIKSSNEPIEEEKKELQSSARTLKRKKVKIEDTGKQSQLLSFFPKREVLKT